MKAENVLPIAGSIAVLVGIILESLNALIPSAMLVAFGHAIGYFGVVIFACGVSIVIRNGTIGGGMLAGALFLVALTTGPSYLAADWLVKHKLEFYGGVGQAIAVMAAIGLGFFVLHLIGRSERRSMWPRTGWILLCTLFWCGALWYELWQQPHVEVSPGKPPRGFVEWEQVVADATGIFVGVLVGLLAWRHEPERRGQEPTYDFLSPLRVHYFVCAGLYLGSAAIAWWLLQANGAATGVIALLSTGAILATFGSAVGSLGGVWERDLLERIQTNLEILHRSVLKNDSPWQRWPFLPRSDKRNAGRNSTLHLTLSNEQLSLNVGTRTVQPLLPTVLEDFFDLPLFSNLLPLLRHRVDAHDAMMGRSDEVEQVGGMSGFDAYCAYECCRDVWLSIAKFRTARYVIHAGAALTITGTLGTGLQYFWLTARNAL